MAELVGIDIPWHEPINPDLVFDQDNPLPPREIARMVIASVPWLRPCLDEDRTERTIESSALLGELGG